ncbi:MAG: hypothetical protein KDK51_05295 [Deltaproteobacteria bacterium]|nr:hypothetical protein [Deltaproteobacteria bacterium]
MHKCFFTNPSSNMHTPKGKDKIRQRFACSIILFLMSTAIFLGPNNLLAFEPEDLRHTFEQSLVQLKKHAQARGVLYADPNEQQKQQLIQQLTYLAQQHELAGLNSIATCFTGHVQVQLNWVEGGGVTYNCVTWDGGNYLEFSHFVWPRLLGSDDDKSQCYYSASIEFTLSPLTILTSSVDFSEIKQGIGASSNCSYDTQRVHLTAGVGGQIFHFDGSQCRPAHTIWGAGITFGLGALYDACLIEGWFSSLDIETDIKVTQVK